MTASGSIALQDVAANGPIAPREIAGNPNLTFIYFIGFVLIAALGVRFCIYALWNRRASDLPSQASIWTALAAVGGAGATYGVVGVLEIVLPAMPPTRDGVFLAFVLLIALAMRLIAREGSVTDSDGAGDDLSRLLVTIFALVVVAVVLGEWVGIGQTSLVALKGLGGVVVAAYGYWHGQARLSSSLVQGTMLDTLLRHLLPVLAFGAFVLAVELVTLAGIDRVIVLHVQIVFVIMTATTLMTANIKLRQNLARL